ncbi:HDOD domain-containing protein [Hydrocarboniclastica marina]|nr:HDOD domain-containing protein [Hydrocarboniclastica marina]
MSSLPAALSEVFAKSPEPLDPELVTRDEAGDGVELIMILLSDTMGHLQVIQRADALLDIDTLNRELGRQLEAIPRAEASRLRTRLQLPGIPAVPGLTGYETVLDKTVAEAGSSQRFIIDSGVEDTLLRFQPVEYTGLCGRFRTLACAIPLTDIAVNFGEPEHDSTQINRALQRFTSLRIKQRLEDTLELPPLPETAQRIIHLRVDPNAEVGDLADVVEADPSLAAQVVSWANSSFYAAPGEVRSIYDAIMRVLGFELVMNLAMGISLGRTLKQPRGLPEGYLDYWQQALWVAQAAGNVTGLMPRNRRPAFGLAYLSGLLHNFGFLVLAHVFPPHLALIIRFSEANRHVDTAYIEHFLLGVTREQIAGQLMERWEMPGEVVTALRHQKNEHYQGLHADYPAVLRLSRQLLLARGIPLGAPEPVSQALIAELGLNEAELNDAMDNLVASRSDIRGLADMMKSA